MVKWTAILILFALHAKAEEIQSSTTAPHSYVQDDFQPYVGLLSGAATSKETDKSSSEFGIIAGYQMLPIAFAVEFSGSEYKDDDGFLKDKTNLILHGLYHFSGDNFVTRYTFLGAGIGTIVRSSATDFTVGPMVGFDVPLSDYNSKNMQHFSLGAVAKYLLTNSTPTQGVAINGSLKYWF